MRRRDLSKFDQARRTWTARPRPDMKIFLTDFSPTSSTSALRTRDVAGHELTWKRKPRNSRIAEWYNYSAPGAPPKLMLLLCFCFDDYLHWLQRDCDRKYVMTRLHTLPHHVTPLFTHLLQHFLISLNSKSLLWPLLLLIGIRRLFSYHAILREKKKKKSCP